MALNTGITEFLDPLDFGGTQAAEQTLESARANAALLRQFSDQSQADVVLPLNLPKQIC